MTAWPLNQPDDPITLEAPLDILCSYHYFAEIDMHKIASWGTRIIGDSGAFSAMSTGAPIDREVFHAWADRWRDDLFWVASLDVIGDQEATFANWMASKDDGLDLVPTLHYGADPSAMDRLVENGATLIGLGGMVPYSSEKERLMRWCLSMHRYARDNHPGVRFHGWGISHPYLVDNLPWWSTDSSGFASCFRFGTLRLFDPRRGRFYGVDLNGRDLAKHARLLRTVYGVDWRDVSVSTTDTRRPLGRVVLKSVQLYADWLQARQRVTPPALLLDKLVREEHGPLAVGALGIDVQSVYLNPEDKLTPKAGPLSVAAMGAPAMQPIKSISPDDSEPVRATPKES